MIHHPQPGPWVGRGPHGWGRALVVLWVLPWLASSAERSKAGLDHLSLKTAKGETLGLAGGEKFTRTKTAYTATALGGASAVDIHYSTLEDAASVTIACPAGATCTHEPYNGDGELGGSYFLNSAMRASLAANVPTGGLKGFKLCFRGKEHGVGTAHNAARSAEHSAAAWGGRCKGQGEAIVLAKVKAGMGAVIDRVVGGYTSDGFQAPPNTNYYSTAPDYFTFRFEAGALERVNVSSSSVYGLYHQASLNSVTSTDVPHFGLNSAAGYCLMLQGMNQIISQDCTDFPFPTGTPDTWFTGCGAHTTTTCFKALPDPVGTLLLADVEVYVRPIMEAGHPDPPPARGTFHQSLVLNTSQADAVLASVSARHKNWRRIYVGSQSSTFLTGNQVAAFKNIMGVQRGPFMLVGKVESGGTVGRVFGAYSGLGFRTSSTSALPSGNTNFLWRFNDTSGAFERTSATLLDDAKAQYFHTSYSGIHFGDYIDKDLSIRGITLGMKSGRSVVSGAYTTDDGTYDGNWLTGAGTWELSELEIYVAEDYETTSSLLTEAMFDDLDAEVGTHLTGSWERCYQGTQFGFRVEHFHHRCDYRGPMFTVARVAGTGRIWGGFSNSPGIFSKMAGSSPGNQWGATYYGGDITPSFLFRYNDSGVFEKAGLIRDSAGEYASYAQYETYHDTLKGPCWGRADIGGEAKFGDTMETGTSYTGGPYSAYTIPADPGSTVGTWLTGSTAWTVDEVEVFVFKQRRTGRVRVTNIPSGASNVTLTATPVSGSPATSYSVALSRTAALPAESPLASLVLTAPSPESNVPPQHLTLTPAFDPSITSYTATVPADTATVDIHFQPAGGVTATASAAAGATAGATSPKGGAWSLYGSRLLSSSMADQLANRVNSTIPSGEWRRCYRGTEDGWGKHVFFSRCAARGTTLLVGRIGADSTGDARNCQGRVIGGMVLNSYLRGSYRKSGGNAFLYRFNTTGGMEHVPEDATVVYTTVSNSPTVSIQIGYYKDFALGADMRTGVQTVSMRQFNYTFSYNNGFGSAATATNKWLACDITGWVLDELEIYYKVGSLAESGMLSSAQVAKLDAELPSDGWTKCYDSAYEGNTAAEVCCGNPRALYMARSSHTCEIGPRPLTSPLSGCGSRWRIASLVILFSLPQSYFPPATFSLFMQA
mmetsp:Transcript_33071/g.105370  ORF Transcript_33071/g.105370 Transcript_33071/m.105370 type:complete len:1164 (-) Transcript_33071:1253-4744(-)